MEMMHGTAQADEFDAHAPNPDSGDFNLCTTDDIEIADGYTQHFEGEDDEVFCIEIADDVTVADRDELEDAAEAVGIDTDTAVEYTLADSREVRDELRARGFDAVRHSDDVPMWGEHETFRVINGDVIGEVTTW